MEPKDYLTDNGLELWKNSVQTAVNALHGNTYAESEKTGKVSYFIDVSDSVLAVVVDPELNAENIREIENLPSYSYKGKYVTESQGVNGFAAFLYDAAQSVSDDSYGYYTPVSVSSDMNMVKGL